MNALETKPKKKQGNKRDAESESLENWSRGGIVMPGGTFREEFVADGRRVRGRE